MQAVWTRWVCACCAWQLNNPTFFSEVYCNQLPLKFLISRLITPILLKRFYCNRGWGFLSPLRQQNNLLPWRNPSLIFPSSACSSVFPSPSLCQVWLLAHLLECWMNSSGQWEALLAACLLRWFISASGQRVHMEQWKWLELLAWDEEGKHGQPFRGLWAVRYSTTWWHLLNLHAGALCVSTGEVW